MSFFSLARVLYNISCTVHVHRQVGTINSALHKDCAVDGKNTGPRMGWAGVAHKMNWSAPYRGPIETLPFSPT